MVIVTVSAGAFVLTGRVGSAYQWKIAQQREHNQPLHFLKTAHPKQASLLRGKKTARLIPQKTWQQIIMARLSLINSHLVIDINKVIFLRPPPFHTWGPPERQTSETFLSQCIECSTRWTLQSIKGSWWQNLIITMNIATRSYFMCWNCSFPASLSLQHPLASMRWKRVYISKILGSIASRRRLKRERASKVMFTARRSLRCINEFN